MGTPLCTRKDKFKNNDDIPRKKRRPSNLKLKLEQFKENKPVKDSAPMSPLPNNPYEYSHKRNNTQQLFSPRFMDLSSPRKFREPLRRNTVNVLNLSPLAKPTGLKERQGGVERRRTVELQLGNNFGQFGANGGAFRRLTCVGC